MKLYFIIIVMVASFVEIHTSQGQSMSIAKMFEEGSITPNIIPKAPASVLKIIYETATAELGNKVCPLRAVLAPEIYFDAKQGSYYTFIFIDPDVPSRAAPTARSRLLALYVNMVNSDVSSGFPLAPYTPPIPGPGSDAHRYIALVYEQSDRIDIYSEPLIDSVIKRVQFSVKDFAINNTLGDPIAGNFFLSELSLNFEKTCKNYIHYM